MAKFPFNNDSTARDRRAELLKSGAGATYHGFAAGEADTIRGRHEANVKSSVTGAEPIDYPAQPATSPWHDEQPVEPPIDATDCGSIFGAALGEPHEIQNSLCTVHSGSVSPSSLDAADGDEQPLDVGTPSPADGAPSPLSHSKRRKR